MSGEKKIKRDQSKDRIIPTPISARRADAGCDMEKGYILSYLSHT